MITQTNNSETIPRLNKYLQMEPFPSDKFRNNLLACLGLDIGAALLWDRLMLLIFAPKILRASFAGTTLADVWGFAKVISLCTMLIWWLANQDWSELEAALEEAKKAQ
jgi:manganese-transporting P-type ATPase